jgi:hypothetical protein
MSTFDLCPEHLMIKLEEKIGIYQQLMETNLIIYNSIKSEKDMSCEIKSLLVRYYETVSNLNSIGKYCYFDEDVDQILFEIRREELDLLVKTIMVNMRCMFFMNLMSKQSKYDLIKINKNLMTALVNLKLAKECYLN